MFRTKTDWVLILILTISIVISAAFILQDSGVVPAFPMDQAFVESANVRLYRDSGHWVFQYPALQNSSGITAYLIAGIYKLLIPTDSNNLNWHFRILSMLMYLGSSFFLIKAFVEDRWTRLLLFIIITTSGYQSIQPSSELIAGSLLAMTFIALRNSWPLALAAFFLATFGLCKVELVMGAVAAAIFWAILGGGKDEPKTWRFLPYTLGWMALLLIPGFFVQGGSPLAGNRSYLAFIATYVELFGPHQFVGNSNIAIDKSVEMVRKNILGTSESVLAIALQHPMLYADFLALQTVKSLIGTAQGLKFISIPFLLVIARLRALRIIRPYIIMILVVAILTLGPAWLLAYIRLRYWVKLFPVVLVLTAWGCLLLGKNRKVPNQLFWICGIGTILWQLSMLSGIWRNSHFY